MSSCPEIVAARREEGRWAVHVIRYGRLCGAGVIPPNADAETYVGQLRASSETVLIEDSLTGDPTPAASAEESERVLRWLESEGARLIHIDGDWICPVGGATRHLATQDAVQEARKELVRFD